MRTGHPGRRAQLRSRAGAHSLGVGKPRGLSVTMIPFILSYTFQQACCSSLSVTTRQVVPNRAPEAGGNVRNRQFAMCVPLGKLQMWMRQH